MPDAAENNGVPEKIKQGRVGQCGIQPVSKGSKGFLVLAVKGDGYATDTYDCIISTVNPVPNVFISLRIP